MDIRTPKEGKTAKDYEEYTKTNHKHYLEVCKQNHVSVFISPHFAIYVDYVGTPKDEKDPNDKIQNALDEPECYSALMNLKYYEKKYYDVELFDIFICLHNRGCIWMNVKEPIPEKDKHRLENLGKIPPLDDYNRHVLNQICE